MTFGGALPQDAVPIALSPGLEALTVTVPAGTPTGQKVDVVVQTPRLTESPAVEVTFQ